MGGGVRWHSGCLPHLQVPAQAARACSGVRVFGRTGGSAERRRGLEPGDDVGGAALALGGAGAVSLACRSLHELAAGFVRATGRKELRRGLEPGDRRRQRGSCPWEALALSY